MSEMTYKEDAENMGNHPQPKRQRVDGQIVESDADPPRRCEQSARAKDRSRLSSQFSYGLFIITGIKRRCKRVKNTVI